LAKRGRKPKNPSLMEALDAKVVREISALLVTILALILVLAEFDAAGSIGTSVFNFFRNLLGPVAYLFPFWVILVALTLFEVNIFKRTKAVFWGFLAFIIIFASLLAPFNNSGGIIGQSIFIGLKSGLGEIASFIILILGSIISLLVIFNLSLTEILSNIKLASPPRVQGGNRVSVFRAVRRRIGMGAEKNGESKPKEPIADGAWQFPSVELLVQSTTTAQPGNVNKNVDILIKTLDDFGVEVSAGRVNIGPTVTQYELKPAEGVKLNNIKARSDDLALALAQHPIRVEAPIPGKSAVGIEVPNKEPAVVTLREVLESEEFKKRKSNLTLPLGKDVSGQVILADLRLMPHLLVAGSTGSGKSVGLNTMLLSLLYQNSPRDLRILLVDPKRVEFSAYNDIPHLYTPVVVEVDKTVNLLRWAIAEMERRFKLFQKIGSRDVDSYNEKVKKGTTDSEGTFHEKLPFVVLVIDELADLMAQASNEVEAAIVRLAQLARATGIHLIVATQRPSVDVITGLIKANITSRIAFAVASGVDSRTIIDQSGAEKLLGNGDMLFLGGEFSKPKRVQGAFASEKDVKSVADFLRQAGKAVYDNSVTEYREVSGIKSGKGRQGSSGSDPMLDEAKRLVVESGTASASFLQRRLQVGYARAARLLDLMEEEGIIGPTKGAKPRDILVDSVDGGDEEDTRKENSF